MQIGWADWAYAPWGVLKRHPTQVAQNDNFYVRVVIENHE